MKNCLDSKLQIDSICSIRIHSREQDIFHKPQQFNSNPSELYSKAYTLGNTWPSFTILRTLSLFQGRNPDLVYGNFRQFGCMEIATLTRKTLHQFNIKNLFTVIYRTVGCDR